uniref:Leucine-rich repeat protein 1 n=1 Tax=Parastrongyloides trichosuri TaxID=131310 RepID=A0A0N4ZYD5_PARTI
MECSFACVKDNVNQRIRYSQASITLTTDPPKTIKSTCKSPLGLEIKCNGKSLSVIPLYEDSIEKIISTNLHLGMLTIFFRDPKKIMYIRNANAEHLKLIYKNLMYLKNGDVDKIDVLHVSAKKISPSILEIHDSKGLVEAKFSKFLTSLTYETKFHKLLPMSLRKCDNLRNLIIKRAFSDGEMEIPKMFFHSLGLLKNLISFTFALNHEMNVGQVLMLLETLPNTITKLSLEENGITELPDSFGKFKNLQILLLGKNNIVTIPKSITYLKKLTHLDITTKDSEIFYAPARCWSSLSNCEIVFGRPSLPNTQVQNYEIVHSKIKELCYCHTIPPPVPVHVPCTLKELAIADGRVMNSPYLIPYNIIEEFSSSFVCDICLKVRLDYMHRCCFRREETFFGRSMIVPMMREANLGLFSYKKICRHCFVNQPKPYIVHTTPIRLLIFPENVFNLNPLPFL